MKRNNILDNTVTVFHNVQSLSKHIGDTVSDDRMMKLLNSRCI